MLGAFSGCIKVQQEDRSQCQWATEFFEHYAERNDWDGFLDRYHEELIFQDVILRLELEGRDAFKEFYNWPDTLFTKHPNHPRTLVVEELQCNGGSAVARGYFTPFYYGGTLYDDSTYMRFTIWLAANEEDKVIRHVDFIEYPPAILQSVGNRLLSDTTNLR